MATIIDFTAKLNERRAAAETTKREQAVQEVISNHMAEAKAAAVNGDVVGMMQHVGEAVTIQENTAKFMPAYCEPSNERKGSKYEATKSISVCDIPALMRADIKAAVKRGDLPKDLKISVRRESCTYSWSINMNITGLPAGVTLYNPEYLRWTGNLQHPPEWPEEYTTDWRSATTNDVPGGMYSPEIQKYLAIMEGIYNAYQRDNSDSQSDYFDVRYYGSVGVRCTLEFAEDDKIKEGNK